MENLRQLLAVMAAMVLTLSVFNSTNFVMHSAFADNGKVTATFGQSSDIELEIDDKMEDGAVIGDLTIETEDGDLADGEYAISLSCTSPETEQALDGSLVVEEGEGDFEGAVSLADGSTYEGCEVAIGEELSVALPSFTVQVKDEKRDDDEEEKSNSGRDNNDDDRNAGSSGNDDEENDKRVNSHNATSSRNNGEDEEDEKDRKESETAREEKRKFKLDVDDDRVEIEVELEGIAMEDGLYNTIFSCDAPPMNITFTDGFEVDDGKGEFKKEFALENGTYTGCELAAGDTVIASFGTFIVSEDASVEQKREERRKMIVSNANATQIHARHVNANPANPSNNYAQGSYYILVANGTAEDETEEDAAVNATMSVWKSTRAVILLDIIDGTVTVGNKTYNIAIGYALYSVNHDAMKIVALVADDSGEVLKLKLRGEAEGDQAEFPQDSGDSLDVSFEGNSGPGKKNNLGGWKLELEGMIQAP